jgi:gluconate 2-dehydrogenase subunit 3-like protein
MDRNRRTLLKVLSAAPVATAFTITDAEAQQAHKHVEQARRTAQKTKAAYKPKFFTAHEYETVRVLSDAIIPRDDRSGGAIDAGVPEFIDFTMVDQPARQTAIRGGLAWLDAESARRFDKTFVAATPAERAGILDDVSGHGAPPVGMTHGVAFFRNFRDLTASGFWTSKIGIADLGYIGNTFVAEWQGCPADVLTKIGARSR